MDASDAARAILAKPFQKIATNLQEDFKKYKEESMAGERKWWARVKPGDKNHGRYFFHTGPHPTEEAAAKAVFESKPKAKEAIVGFGNQGGHFGVRTVKRTEIWPEPAFGLNDTYNVKGAVGKGGRILKEEVLDEADAHQAAPGIVGNLKKRGWALKDSGKLGATYIRKGISIVVDKDAWSHDGATGKDIDSLEAHLKSYFDTKRSDVKEEKEDKDDKKDCHCKEDGHTYKDGKCTCCGKKKDSDGDKDDDKDDKKDFKKFKKEDAELTELSRGKLAAYSKASHADATDRADRSDDDRKIDKRITGTRRALRKIGTKMAEEAELSELTKKQSVQAKRDFVNSVKAKHGATVHHVDHDEHPPIKGMEGPFRMKSGHVLHYDPKEGKYYDRKRDMYVGHDEHKKMSEEIVRRIKEAAVNAPDPELHETLGFDTGDLMEVTEFATAHIHAPGGDALGGNELVAYHQRMMAHHQKLMDLATAYAGSGDAAKWNTLAGCHAKHVEGHAKWLEGVNKSAGGFPVSGSPGGGVSESYRDELLNEVSEDRVVHVTESLDDEATKKQRIQRALGLSTEPNRSRA